MTAARGSDVPRGLHATLLVLAFGLFVTATNALVIAGLLQHIAVDLHVSANDVTLAITAYAAVVAVLAPAFTIVLARVPRTPLMAGGLLVVAAGTVVVAIAPDLAVFTVGRVISAIGGAALVPTATAAAASLSPVHRQGRSIAVVVGGFVAASALGAPLGTAAAIFVGWRGALLAVAISAFACAAATLVRVGRVPLAPSMTVRARLGTLLDPRLVLSLAATVGGVAAFNVIYIFSSQLTLATTGGSGGLLALLLLSLGLAGLVGNALSGRLTDRYGSRIVFWSFALPQVAAMAMFPLLAWSLPMTFVAFAMWGLTSTAQQPAVQLRQVLIEPTTASIALAWNSTALYLGVAVAPLLGRTAIHAAGVDGIPLQAALLTVLSLAAFELGFHLPGRTPPAAS